MPARPPTATHLPRFDAENPFPLAAGQFRAQSRVWLGNATQVASHFDLSDNFAVVALGRRRFTLFPPEATKDLYVGPLNVTIAGQPVSMVDPLAPDLERYPRYAAARELALTADLGPGDALFVPSLWWHHVQATEPVNVLINYWHNDVERGGGFPALIHAMLAIRDLPARAAAGLAQLVRAPRVRRRGAARRRSLAPARARGERPAFAGTRRSDPSVSP